MPECRNVGLLLQQAGQLVEYARVAELANRAQLHPGVQFMQAYQIGTTFFLAGPGTGGGLGLDLYGSDAGEVFDLVVWDERTHDTTSKERYSDLGTAVKLALWRGFSGYVTDIRSRASQERGDFTFEKFQAELFVNAQFVARGLHPDFVVGPAPVERRPEGLAHLEDWSVVSSKSNPSVWAVVDSEEDISSIVASQVLAMSVDEIMEMLLREYPEPVSWRRYPLFEANDPMTAPSVADVLLSSSSVGGAGRRLAEVFRGRDIGDQVDARLTGGGWFQFGDAAAPWLVWLDGQVFRAGQVGDTPPADGSAFPGFASLERASQWVVWQHGNVLRQRLGLAPASVSVERDWEYEQEEGPGGSTVLFSPSQPSLRAILPVGTDLGVAGEVLAARESQLLKALGEGL